jgi:uncharacterized protein YjbI with pentapeptide repeats
LSRAYLSGACLGQANLIGADLSGADLVGADLKSAELAGADLVGAHFRAADLNGARLRGANLSGAHLCEAKLHDVDLSGAHLREADLTGADLTGAIFARTGFGFTQLRNVIGLNSCIHFGPSILDYHTLAQSGKLPFPFLRGCGLSDEFIEFLPSLLNEAIQFHSCFISYSTRDQEFAERLHADLQDKGVRCWFAPHDIKGGRKIHEQIDEAIRLHDRLLLILSEHSMSSEWVKTELAKARKRETKEGKRVLFPVRLVGFERLRDWECFDADTGKDSAREIREYFIPDFSNWKEHDSYQAGLGKLIGDLKSSG